MQIFDFIATRLLNITIPIVVFIECLVILLWLRKLSLNRLTSWAAGARWPADAVLCEPIKRPLFILCVISAAYAGLATSSVADNWKGLIGHSLWTLFSFTIVLGVLNLANGSISFLGNRWNLPNITSRARAVTRVIIIIVSALVVLFIWGLPTIPLLLVIGIASMLIILTLRDAAPNFFATLEIVAEKQIKVGNIIKLENGEEGRITGMGWTSTHLQTVTGDDLIIPNSQLTRQKITRIKIKNSGLKSIGTDLSSYLTRRELEIVNLINKGAKNKEIAEKLFITENTAKVHVKNILKKLELKSRQQLAVLSECTDSDNDAVDQIS